MQKGQLICICFITLLCFSHFCIAYLSHWIFFNLQFFRIKFQLDTLMSWRNCVCGVLKLSWCKYSLGAFTTKNNLLNILIWWLIYCNKNWINLPKPRILLVVVFYYINVVFVYMKIGKSSLRSYSNEWQSIMLSVLPW